MQCKLVKLYVKVVFVQACPHQLLRPIAHGDAVDLEQVFEETVGCETAGVGPRKCRCNRASLEIWEGIRVHLENSSRRPCQYDQE